ncbi:MAG TPA: hypothetical protein VIH63_14265, partial [Xanthobacteraceae bacterium]
VKEAIAALLFNRRRQRGAHPKRQSSEQFSNFSGDAHQFCHPAVPNVNAGLRVPQSPRISASRLEYPIDDVGDRVRETHTSIALPGKSSSFRQDEFEGVRDSQPPSQ